MMKKIIIALMAILAMCMVYAAPIPAGADLEITLVSQTPDPVQPGDYVDIRFKIENYGGASTEELWLELVEDYPFSMPGSDNIIKLGNMQARQVGDEGIVVKFKVKVDENAVEGANELTLRYKQYSETRIGIPWIELEPFDINVQTRDSIIAIAEVTTDHIAPGETGTVSLKLTNLADSLLREVRVNLDLFTTYQLAASVSEVTKPFSPIGSTNEKAVLKIDAHGTTTVDFDLMADPDAASGIYKIPVNIKYSDEVGKNYSKDLVISIIIGGDPDLIATLDGTDIYTSGSKGTVDVKFINKGSADVKFLYVRMQDSDGYTIIGPKEEYVGNIDSDDFETADFDLYVEAKGDSVELPIEIEYKDANNKDYTKVMKLKMPLYSMAEAKKLGFVQGKSGTGFFLILIIVGAGVFLYWRKKKKKKKA
ncbi:MAG: COG1361 S-layer family protein [Nanoarchaeota archaeon]|nr:COG1361 S-layer family protein [Nanoarchaeota archaeon]MBU1704235.1 COG1361 S-layer family protein [Nanoarchaeota archaeon]